MGLAVASVLYATCFSHVFDALDEIPDDTDDLQGVSLWCKCISLLTHFDMPGTVWWCKAAFDASFLV